MTKPALKSPEERLKIMNEKSVMCDRCGRKHFPASIFCTHKQREHFLHFLRQPSGVCLRSEIHGFEWTRDMLLSNHLHACGGLGGVW